MEGDHAQKQEQPQAVAGGHGRSCVKWGLGVASGTARSGIRTRETNEKYDTYGFKFRNEAGEKKKKLQVQQAKQSLDLDWGRRGRPWDTAAEEA